MGRYFALTLGMTAPPQTKPKTKSKSSRKLDTGFWILILVAALGMTYLFQVNDLATKKYEIRELERRLTELKEANKRLDLEAASLRSIETIEQGVKNLNLVPGGNMNYFKDNGFAYQR